MTKSAEYFIINLGDVMISRLLIFESEQTNPYLNLAYEKYLFENSIKGALILFLWQNENTVVIGKNQNPWAECRCALLEKEGGFIARRMSGGGAVFHGEGNLNFTFLADDENFDTPLHFEIIKKSCKLCGIDAEISGRNDILTNGKKFSGNAFYHSGGRSYHHGTLLISEDKERLNRYLTPNAEKLKAKGVKSVAARTVNLCEIAPELTPQIMRKNIISAAEQVLGLKAEFITEINTEKVNSIARFFGSWDFIFGTTLPFELTVSNRLSFGLCELNLNLKNGKISDVRLYTDALDTSISEKLEKALKDCEFSLISIKNRLAEVFEESTANELLTLIEKALAE